MKTIDALNNVIKMDDSATEEVEDEDQIETVLESDDDDIFICDECEFRTRTKTGIKFHNSKIHDKVRCNTYYREFTTKEKLNRHVEAETTFGNICDKVSQKKDFELKENLADENFLGICYTIIPELALHAFSLIVTSAGTLGAILVQIFLILGDSLKLISTPLKMEFSWTMTLMNQPSTPQSPCWCWRTSRRRGVTLTGARQRRYLSSSSRQLRGKQANPEKCNILLVEIPHFRNLEYQILK